MSKGMEPGIAEQKSELSDLATTTTASQIEEEPLLPFREWIPKLSKINDKVSWAYYYRQVLLDLKNVIDSLPEGAVVNLKLSEKTNTSCAIRELSDCLKELENVKRSISNDYYDNKVQLTMSNISYFERSASVYETWLRKFIIEKSDSSEDEPKVWYPDWGSFLEYKVPGKHWSYYYEQLIGHLMSVQQDLPEGYTMPQSVVLSRETNTTCAIKEISHCRKELGILKDDFETMLKKGYDCEYQDALLSINYFEHDAAIYQRWLTEFITKFPTENLSQPPEDPDFWNESVCGMVFDTNSESEVQSLAEITELIGGGQNA
ncbi:MAG: hypothetical protein KA998_01005 [Rickettsiaceae bacterium]|nr:hypothetical protein [Rickettsiaceae bacterium]